MAPQSTICLAKLEDVPTIYSFIQAAAAEQVPGAIIAATEASLAATLHFEPSLPETAATSPSVSQRRYAWPLLIKDPDGMVVGLAIYFYNYSTWAAAPGLCLEEFYVLPEYRRKGYGRLLIEGIAKEAHKAGCVKMEWVCLKNNERALRFYDKLGAKLMDDWLVLKVAEKDIGKLATAV
ncbi:acyl-CoA N-acyltransferase [Thozetella sp. PMI_491]|nr:acyl-CoA N-acyltransferase [Thozetella sp. PMI_491]